MTRRCAILCSGPSLATHDLSKIDCPTIGTNLSYLTHPADIQVFTHGHLIQTYGERLVTETPDAVERFCALEEIEGCFTPKMIWKHNTVTFKAGEKIPRLPLNYDIHRDGWIFCGSAPSAIQVAVSEGFDEIVFLGLDLHLEGGKHSYPDDIFTYAALETSETLGPEARQTKRAFLIQRDFLCQFKPQLDRRGISVVNTSLDSMEDTFERRSFDSIWPA